MKEVFPTLVFEPGCRALVMVFRRSVLCAEKMGSEAAARNRVVIYQQTNVIYQRRPTYSYYSTTPIPNRIIRLSTIPTVITSRNTRISITRMVTRSLITARTWSDLIIKSVLRISAPYRRNGFGP